MLSVVFTYSQTKQAEALKLFNSGNYAEAAEIYASIILSNNRDIPLNYYYGVCLYYLKQDIDESIRRLQFSLTRPVSTDVHYYLGKLFQQVYEMELAAEHLETFLDLSKTTNSKTIDAEQTMQDCLSAVRLINKYFEIHVLNKDTVEKSRVLNQINLSKDAGELLLSQNFFVTGVERDQVIFKTERGNEVFFPKQERNKSWNLYKIVKLLDTWSEPEPLGAPINSDYDDLYPFLLIDGVTLYFSSNRPGGMGGFDIYQTIYDPETGIFSEPANLGPPFNSPDDDFLLAPDEYLGKAWFVTNRGIDKTEHIVVEIVWDESLIKNNTENVHQLKQIVALPLSDKDFGQLSKKSPQNDNRNRETSENKIYFLINDTLIYTSIEQFRSEDALNVFKSGFDSEQKKNIFISHLDKKRETYAQSYDRNEKNKLYNEIVQLERQTYGMEENIAEKYVLARKLELEKINHLKKTGQLTIKTDKIENKHNIEYKIQIGVFTNEPTQLSLENIPTVTKSEPDADGLTKYYSGSWSKYEDALSMVDTIREAGFSGAFVVAFLNGERITLDKAKKIE